jgi:HD-like signal output (HDOD) protein
MVPHPLLIVLIVILLLCAILYPFFHRGQDIRKKEGIRDVDRRDRRSGNPSSSNFQAPRDRSDLIANVSYTESAGTDEEMVKFKGYFIAGINEIFGEAESEGRGVPPLMIDEVHDDVRKQVLFHIASLKNVDTVYRLQRVMGDSKTTMAELSLMITSNPLLSAKILQIANSAYYGMEQKLNSISHAIMIIGMVNIKAIIYHEGVLQALNEKSFKNNPTMKTVWQHANYTSIYASYLHYLFGGLNMGNLFTLGLLHDIGKFIMMKLTPLSQCDDKPPLDYSPNWTMAEEEKIYGINHALVGRLALRQWGLSRLMVDTVTLHHALACRGTDGPDLDKEALQYLIVIFLADQAARLFAGRDSDDVRVDRLHPSYRDLIDRNKLSQLIVDKSLMGQLREAEAITGVYA